MKDFACISSNQITVHDPENKHFRLMSEIIITAIEPKYVVVHNNEGKAELAKFPEVETFRFFASAEHLTLLRDRINQELAMHKKIAKDHIVE